VIAQLKGTDGKENHVVCLTDGWMFDSNFKEALCINRTNLDLCCSSDDSPHDKFDEVVLALKFPSFKRMKTDSVNGKRRQRKRKQLPSGQSTIN
jgi:hypothetical protein